jgi:hypothetical protein
MSISKKITEKKITEKELRYYFGDHPYFDFLIKKDDNENYDEGIIEIIYCWERSWDIGIDSFPKDKTTYRYYLVLLWDYAENIRDIPYEFQTEYLINLLYIKTFDDPGGYGFLIQFIDPSKITMDLIEIFFIHGRASIEDLIRIRPDLVTNDFCIKYFENYGTSILYHVYKHVNDIDYDPSFYYDDYELPNNLNKMTIMLDVLKKDPENLIHIPPMYIKKVLKLILSEICIALQDLDLPAPQTILILEAYIEIKFSKYLENHPAYNNEHSLNDIYSKLFPEIFKFHELWNITTKVKHFTPLSILKDQQK